MNSGGRLRACATPFSATTPGASVFKPIPDEAVGLLENVVEMIARGPISSASLNVRGRCKAKFFRHKKGKIKVSPSETRSLRP